MKERGAGGGMHTFVGWVQYGLIRPPSESTWSLYRMKRPQKPSAHAFVLGERLTRDTVLVLRIVRFRNRIKTVFTGRESTPGSVWGV